jgi:type II secretory pathway pseudopilin PulG
MRNRSAFTLIELLVVVVIIIVVSAVALPTILPALSHREVSAAARIVQGALVGARDAAIRDNSPSGIRLLPDPAQANAYNRIIPLSTPPSYSEGLVNNFPGQVYTAAVMLGTSAIVLEEAPGQWVLPPGATAYKWVPNSPTSWQWNVRLGDKIQINNAGPWYTVAGPSTLANSEGFVSWGASGQPGSQSPLQRTYASLDGQSMTLNPDYLLLTNGRDDNANGWVDEGWDGVDNNAINGIDELAEWEPETWITPTATLAAYTVQRRPVPGVNARETPLPSNVVIDASRSKIQVNPLTSQVDIIVNPNGSMWPAILYSTPASVLLGGSFFQLWLAERSDMGSFQQVNKPPAPLSWVQSTPTGQWWLLSVNAKTGDIASIEQPDLVTGYSKAMQGVQ